MISRSIDDHHDVLHDHDDHENSRTKKLSKLSIQDALIQAHEKKKSLWKNAGIKAFIKINSGSVPETPPEKKRKKKSYVEVKKRVEQDLKRKKHETQKDQDLNIRLKEDLVRRGITAHPLLRLAEEKAYGLPPEDAPAPQEPKARVDRTVSFAGGMNSGACTPRKESKTNVAEDSKAMSVRSVRTTQSATSAMDYASRPRGLQAYDIALNPIIEQKMRMKRYGYYKPKVPFVDSTLKEESYREGSWSSEVSNQSSQGMVATTLKLKSPYISEPQTPRVSKMFPFGRPITTCPGRQTAPWLNARLQHSCRAVRFGLPVDLLMLEDMTPMEYLLKYCFINDSRKHIYQLAFEKKLKKGTKIMNYQQVVEAMVRVTAGQVEEGDIKALFKLLRLNLTKMTITLEEFGVICAVGERLLYATLAGRQGEAGVCRSYLESADFCRLEWRLREMTLKDQHTRRLLLSLGG